jgi:hypothetical protein
MVWSHPPPPPPPPTRTAALCSGYAKIWIWLPHWTENSEHTFPEMKLRGLVHNFYLHVSGSDLYIPTIGLTWNLYFLVLHESTLGSTTGAERRAGNCRQAVLGNSSLTSTPLPRLSREFTQMTKIHNKNNKNKFPIWKIRDHRRKQLILVVNFLFAEWDSK